MCAKVCGFLCFLDSDWLGRQNPITWLLLCQSDFTADSLQVDDEPFPVFNFVKESCESGEVAINWNVNAMQVLIPACSTVLL